MNVPKLRFKEFNDEYKYRNLSDISTLIKDGTHGTHENYENGIPLLSAKDINNNKINIPEDCRKISVDDYNKIYKNYLLKKDDILLTIVGSIGRTALYKNEKVAFQRSVAAIRIDGNNNSNYIRQYIESHIIINQLNNMTNSSAQGGVYLSSLSKLNFDIPRKEEQLKVAKFLSLLDKKIEFQFKKIEDLKLFKKGLINSIGKNIEIEKIPLKNILAEQNHKTIKNNEYEILSSTSKGIYLQKDYFNKQAASDNNVGYKILKKNQLVLSPQNLWMGNININSKYNIGIVSPSYKIFDINNNIDIDFFDYWIKSPKALYEYKISSEQGASIVRRNLNMDLFYEIKVDIPKGKMQNKLGRIIKLLNLKIQYNENSLQKLQELKKGLMQNMFV